MDLKLVFIRPVILILELDARYWIHDDVFLTAIFAEFRPPSAKHDHLN